MSNYVYTRSQKVIVSILIGNLHAQIDSYHSVEYSTGKYKLHKRNSMVPRKLKHKHNDGWKPYGRIILGKILQSISCNGRLFDINYMISHCKFMC